MIRNIDRYEQNIEKNRSEKKIAGNKKLEREKKTIISKKNQNKLSPISKAAAKL